MSKYHKYQLSLFLLDFLLYFNNELSPKLNIFLWSDSNKIYDIRQRKMLYHRLHQSYHRRGIIYWQGKMLHKFDLYIYHDFVLPCGKYNIEMFYLIDIEGEVESISLPFWVWPLSWIYYEPLIHLRLCQGSTNTCIIYLFDLSRYIISLHYSDCKKGWDYRYDIQ